MTFKPYCRECNSWHINKENHMAPMNYAFDATQFEPSQSVGAHPVGKFPATISNTLIKPTKAGDGGMFEVVFTTQAGSISNRYNLWNKEPKAVEIAHKELSALCYATGIFKLDFNNDGAALRNARCMIEVDKQPNSEYMEVKKVLDVNGNEPGRQSSPAPQPQQAPQQTAGQAPMQPNASGGWGAPQGAPQGWQQPAQQQPFQQQPSQGNAGKPPWAQ